MLRIPAVAAAGAAAGPASGRKPARKSASSTARPAADVAASGAAGKLRRGSTGETEGMGAAVAAGALGPHVVAKTWQQQVERVTAPMGSVAPSLQGKENRFRSTAVYCEVRHSRGGRTYQDACHPRTGLLHNGRDGLWSNIPMTSKSLS